MYGYAGGSSQQPYPPSTSSAANYSPSSSRDRDMRDSHAPPVPSSTRPIGSTLDFTSGQFNGKQVRAQLIELQKADLGRKYARKDRRPLDPPPVVQLRLYTWEGSGDDAGEREVEDYGEIQTMGLICHVDLFPVPSTTDASGSSPGRQDAGQPSGYASSSSTMSSATAYSSNTNQYPYTFPAPQPPPPGASLSTVPAPIHQPYGAQQQAQPPAPANDVVFMHSGYPVTESSKCTESLAGTTFVQAANLDYKGNKVLMFVFSDLAVKMEGNFILRYRCFDLFSKVVGEANPPVWAECYGGAFRVYSTKEFPGLRASTDLTKHLSYFGVRLNLRETERKRRKKVEDPLMPIDSIGPGSVHNARPALPPAERSDGGGHEGYRSHDD